VKGTKSLEKYRRDKKKEGSKLDYNSLLANMANRTILNFYMMVLKLSFHLESPHKKGRTIFSLPAQRKRIKYHEITESNCTILAHLYVQ